MLHVAESRPDEGGRGDVCAGPAPSYVRESAVRECGRSLDELNLGRILQNAQTYMCASY